MRASEIIRALGGATELARKGIAKRSAISNWARDGIPGRHWPALARVAVAKGVKGITLEVIEHHERESLPSEQQPSRAA